MTPSKETLKIDALLKEYELVELEIDNHLQNMSTMGSLFVTALVILIGFIITESAHELLLFIPFFLCITSVYLLNHKRTVTFDAAYANEIEDKINALLEDGKTIYFEHMSRPMWKAKSDMEGIIIIASITAYLGALIYYNKQVTKSTMLADCYDILMSVYYEDLKVIDILMSACSGLKDIDSLIAVYCVALACITVYYVLIPMWTSPEWIEELEARIKDEDSSRSNLPNKKYLINKKLSNFKNRLSGWLVGAFRR